MAVIGPRSLGFNGRFDPPRGGGGQASREQRTKRDASANSAQDRSCCVLLTLFNTKGKTALSLAELSLTI